MNFSPLHSRLFSSSVSLWDEKLNIFGQIFLVSATVWWVVSVKLLTISLLFSISDWLSSPRCNKNSDMSSFVVSYSAVLSLLVGLFVTMGQLFSDVMLGLCESMLQTVLILACVVVVGFVMDIICPDYSFRWY